MNVTYNPLKELTLVRIREFYREPEVIFWVYIFPMLLIVGIGLAFREAKPVRVVVAAEADALAERRLQHIVKVLEAQQDFQIERVSLSHARRLESRNPPDLRLIARSDSVHYIFDPAQAGGRSAHLRVNQLLQEAAGREDQVPTRVEHLTRRGSRYIDWLVPGLIGMNLMGGGLWSVGFVCVDQRMRKLLKRFYATPMRRSHFLLSLVGSRMLFLIPEMAVILLVAYLGFGVHVHGSLFTLAVVILVGAACFSGLGLLTASRAQKIETISGLLNVVMMPMWILSGIFFSSERFPETMQPFVQALPLTQLNNALRAVMLDGAGLPALWLPVGALLLWASLSFCAALRWFRWQ